MRVIIAIEPSIAVVERIALLQEDLADALHALGFDAAWNRAHEIRLVLWTGDMEDGELGHARIALRERLADLGPFEFDTRGTHFAPGEDSPRLLVVEAARGAEQLGTLRAAVVEALGGSAGADGSAAVDGRPLEGEAPEWRPLIRVGRMKTSHATHPASGVLRPYSETAYGTSAVTDVLVVTTELVGGRVRSRLVDRVDLAG